MIRKQWRFDRNLGKRTMVKVLKQLDLDKYYEEITKIVQEMRLKRKNLTEKGEK